MDTRTFLDNFGAIAEAPGGIDRLRGLILDLAVRGRLVPQRESEGSAKELVEELRSERHRRSPTKRPRGEIEPVANDEVPFALPPTWAWVRLPTVSADLGQGIPTQPFSYIDVGAIDNEAGTVGETAVLSPEDAPSRARKSVARGSVIYSTVRPYLRNIAVLDRDFDPPAIASTAFNVYTPLPGVIPIWVFHCLRSPYFTSYVEAHQKGVAYPAINNGDMSRAPLPLPPTGEQQRIAAKVDELLQLCDDIEARQETRHQFATRLRASALDALTTAGTPADLHTAWSRIHTNWDALTDSPDGVEDIRHTILQLVVRGLLVPQDPSEGTASDLLHRISGSQPKSSKPSNGGNTDDGMHGIPSTWEWVHLSRLLNSIQAGKSPTAQKRPKAGDEWGVLKVSACSWGRFLPEENKALLPDTAPNENFEVHDGDFLISRANTQQLVARSVIVGETPPRLLISDKTLRLSVIASCDPRYLNLANLAGAARAHYEQNASGTSDSMRNVSQQVIRATPIPLPPTAEQRRIVAKTEALMHFCDQLEVRLRDRDAASISLSSALTSIS